MLESHPNNLCCTECGSPVFEPDDGFFCSDECREARCPSSEDDTVFLAGVMEELRHFATQGHIIMQAADDEPLGSIKGKYALIGIDDDMAVVRAPQPHHFRTLHEWGAAIATATQYPPA